MSHKKKVNKNIEKEDETEIYGNLDICFYDKELLELLMSSFSAITGAAYAHNISDSIENVLSFDYYNNILLPNIKDHEEHPKADWYSLDYFIKCITFMQKLCTILDSSNRSTKKSYSDMKERLSNFINERAEKNVWSLAKHMNLLNIFY